MKMILQREASADVYTAPQCRVYTVSLENVIAQSPGTIPDDDIIDEEDDD
ncbi:MAG: hypothetical protein J6T04_00495 [Bacteroidales bacterium]|nr:hypothetical protein [Bacteroidales bacterium]